MNRAGVAAALAEFPDNKLDQSAEALDYVFGNSLAIYDKDGKVYFIGDNFYKGCGCDYSYRPELFELLAAVDGGMHEYDDLEYDLPTLKITVGAESRPVYGQVGVLA